MIQARRHENLPIQLTSFVGRDRELRDVCARLAEHRLVTLTGAGGVGKTRLALEVAARAETDYKHGVWAIELAPLADAAHVATELAARLGIELRGRQPVLTVLKAQLADRELLLILDNCEHLVTACAALARSLLETCPNVRLLVTSRELLSVPGEVVYVVPPLGTPDPRAIPSAPELAEYDAVQLFAERARLVRADFALTQDTAASVIEICHRLDGIPLAIELAAARVRAISVDELATRLASGPFRLLTGSPGAPSRQQTLEAALDWSYALLNDGERTLLRRLSVFVGGFELDAAEAICGGETILEDLTGLVDKSLVVAGRRYRQLEPIRQFAAERLAESGQSDAVSASHRNWYLALAERAVDRMTNPDQVAWFERLEAEHDNLRSALEFSRREMNLEAELRLVGALAPFWGRTRHVLEGRARIDDVLSRAEWTSSPAARRALVLALDWRGYLDPRPRNAYAERAVVLARELGDSGLLAQALRHLAFNPAPVNDLRALLEEAVSVARVGGADREVGYATVMLAQLSLDEGEVVEAERLASEAFGILQQVGDRDALRTCLYRSAKIARARGERARARAHLEAAVVLSRELHWMPVPYDALLLASLDAEEGDFRAAAARLHALIADSRRTNITALVFAVSGVADLAAMWGDPRAAARLFAATARHRASHSLDSAIMSASEDAAAVRSALGGDAFAAAWAEGEGMSLEAAVTYALGLEPPSQRSVHATTLTTRELQVARLVAAGKSNREIAAALVIAEPTAERHVANIFSKLSFHTRAQIAGWYERHVQTDM